MNILDEGGARVFFFSLATLLTAGELVRKRVSTTATGIATTAVEANMNGTLASWQSTQSLMLDCGALRWPLW